MKPELRSERGRLELGAARAALGRRLLLYAPFRSMKDVSCGTREQRIAAYRHNLRMRGELTACMLRWTLAVAVAALLTEGFDALGERAFGLERVFVYLAAACATFVVCGICVLLLTAYVYLHLTRHER